MAIAPTLTPYAYHRLDPASPVETAMRRTLHVLGGACGSKDVGETALAYDAIELSYISEALIKRPLRRRLHLLLSEGDQTY